MNRLGRNFFVLAIMVLGIVCRAIDVVGTHMAQPHLEAEGNPLARFMDGLPDAARWQIVVASKIAWVALCSFSLSRVLAQTTVPSGAPRLGLLATLQRFGKDRTRNIVLRNIETALALFSLLWAAAAYAGLENIAYHFGWWSPLGFTYHGLWVPYGVIGVAVCSVWLSARLFGWQGFNSNQSCEAYSNVRPERFDRAVEPDIKKIMSTSDRRASDQ